MFHHRWWVWLIMSLVAGYFTALFDMLKEAPLEDDDYGEDKEDKYKGKR